MDILRTLLGDYHYYFIIGALEVSILFVYFIVLTWGKHKKELGIFRLTTSYVYQLFVCLAISFIRTHNDTLGMRIFYEIIILIMLLITLFFCFEEKISEILLCFSSIVATKNLSGTAIPLIRNLLGNNDLDNISFFPNFVPARDWPIYYGIQIIFLVVISYFFQKGELHREETLDINGSLLLVGAVFIIRGILHPITRHYQPMSFDLSICIKILMLILYLLIIAIRAGLLSRKKILSELQTTEQLLLQEQKRYEEMRNNVEVINMKCHDIKRQLSTFQGKLTENEILALQEAIKIYDSNINTGNEILDTILYQKKLYCDQNNINLSWLTDGAALSFIAPSKLYALLANALENAIEAVLKLDTSKRVVSLTVIQKDNSVTINVTNFYDTEKVPITGTDKEDKVHHGFGLKSMKYIANEYNGSLQISSEDNIFYLSIILPIPKTNIFTNAKS